MLLDVTVEEAQVLLNALALMNPLFQKLAMQLQREQARQGNAHDATEPGVVSAPPRDPVARPAG